MRLRRSIFLMLSLALPAMALAKPSRPLRVLVMHWYDRTYSTNDVFDKTLKSSLQASAPQGLEYYSEYLETNRFPGARQERLLKDYLLQKYADTRLDVLIAGASTTLEFLLKYRHELFPNVPIVFATDRAVTEDVLSEAGAAGFIFGQTFAKTVDLALQLHPGTKHVFVVSGTLNHDQSLEATVREDLAGNKHAGMVEYLTDVAPEELPARVKTLPRNSLILYVWQQALDAQGRLLETWDILARVTDQAKVPIYGKSHAMIGRGPVGGYVWTPEGVAGKLAEITQKVVTGTQLKDIPIEKGPDTAMFDWRQLQRWGISGDRLPAGSVIRFRELTTWEQYKWRILGAMLVFLLQSLLIGALLVQRKRARRAQRVLQESEERFRKMADTAPTMIWVFGPDRTCTFLNRTWLTFTGRSLEQGLGAGWDEGVHPDDRERVSKTWSAALAVRAPFEMEYRRRRADGQYRSLQCTAIPRFHDDKTFAGFIGSCVDITDLILAQERALAGQRLELMGTLANGIAHDFNNLLGGIGATAELALAELDGNFDCREELTRILKAVDAGAQIVREVMVFAGQPTSVQGDVDCSLLIREMSQVLKVSISKSATLSIDLATDLGLVRGNAAQLKQLIMNLVVNASQAIGDQEGQIRIRATMLTPEQRTSIYQTSPLAEREYVQIEILDDGTGMPDEIKGRIFDAFFTTKPDGRGLGLAVAQCVVRAHGGIATVVSSPGQGTTFRVLLPCLPRSLHKTGGSESKTGSWESPGCDRLTIAG
jgi:PAS domain S-box-containing protein